MAGAGHDSRDPQGDFGEADLEADELGPIDERCSFPPLRTRRESDIYALTVPPGEYPDEPVPDTIEQAVREAAEQVPRTPVPERPSDAVQQTSREDEPTVVIRRVRRA